MLAISNYSFILFRFIIDTFQFGSGAAYCTYECQLEKFLINRAVYLNHPDLWWDMDDLERYTWCRYVVPISGTLLTLSFTLSVSLVIKTISIRKVRVLFSYL